MSEQQHTGYSACVYYYDEQKDHLLLDCIQPLFTTLAPVVEKAFFVRHWLRGPHVRLCFLTTDKLFHGAVRPAIEEQVGSYLRVHPSHAAIDAEKMRPVYESLAELEQERGPILPLSANNSLHYIPYERRLHVLKSGLVAEVIERFYAEANDLAFRMLEAVRQGQNRLLLSLDLLFTTAHLAPGPITRGFISYRSHAESFLTRVPNPEATRAFFEKKYAPQRENLMLHLRQLLDALDRQQDAVAPLLEWAALLKHYWDFALPLLQAHELDLMPIEKRDSEEVYRQRREYSTFHQRFYQMRESRERLYTDPFFQVYRLMLNLLYLHLNRLGIQSLERALLGHLAANTVEDFFSLSAVELLGQQ